MKTVLPIRKRLAMSQDALGQAIGVTQGMVSGYETGRHEISPDAAAKLIRVAASRGLSLTMDQIYGVVPMPSTEEAEPCTAAA